MKCVTIVAVCAIIFNVNGQDAPAQASENAPAPAPENDGAKPEAVADVQEAAQVKDIESKPTEVVEATKGFPPYNYVPTENSSGVDYDLDATTTEPATVPANRTGLANQARTLQKGGLTFKEISERINRQVFLCNVYRVTAAFSWLTVLASVLTLLFKIHEYYLH